jgi:uncharacterized protein YneF (UPF0154 family)
MESQSFDVSSLRDVPLINDEMVDQLLEVAGDDPSEFIEELLGDFFAQCETSIKEMETKL